MPARLILSIVTMAMMLVSKAQSNLNTNSSTVIYTIDKAQPASATNFQSFTSAAAFLNAGINAPIIINVAAAGVYNEQFLLNNIPGTSNLNTITINGNGSVITFLSTNTNERANIKLNGTDYITINNLILNIEASSEFGYGVHIVGGADNNSISNCIINLPANSGNQRLAGVVIGSSSASTPSGAGASGPSFCDSNLVSGNTINGGYVGISMCSVNTNLISGNKIVGNIIKDMYSEGIFIMANENPVVQRNDVSRPSRSVTSAFFGIQLLSTAGAKVTANKLHNAFDANQSTTHYAYGIKIAGPAASATKPNVISNNLIYGFNNLGSHYGIYLSNCSYANFYCNSIQLDGASAMQSYTYGIALEAGTDNIQLKNNIFQILRTSSKSVAMISYYDVPGFISDFNNLYVTASSTNHALLVSFNSNSYSNLNSWKQTGYDSHSLSVNSRFNSSLDLHLSNSSPLTDKGTFIQDVNADIDNESRDMSIPAIGADEIQRTTARDMRAELLQSPSGISGCFRNEIVKVVVRNYSLTPIDFVQTPMTVILQITGAISTQKRDTIKSGTLAAGELKDIAFSTQVDMSTIGTYFFMARTEVNGDVNPGNDSMPVTTVIRDSLKGGVTSIYPLSVCHSATVTVSAIGFSGASDFQWLQSDFSDSGYTNFGTTSNTYHPITVNISGKKYFKLMASCGTDTSVSSYISTYYSDPHILSTTPGSRCGEGAVGLAATANTGFDPRWYNVPSGGTILGVGTNFTTPVINTSTNFYVEAGRGGIYSGGPANPNALGSPSSTYQSFVLHFVVSEPIILHSVDIYKDADYYDYPFHPENIYLQYDSSVPTPFLKAFEFGSITNQIPWETLLEPGAYKMTAMLRDNTLVVNPTGIVYPYVTGPLSITGASFNPLSPVAQPNWFGGFYNWKFNTTCSSDRVAVLATVNPAVGSWTGLGDNNWENPLNWACNVIPNSTTAVTIPPGAVIIINSNVTVYSMYVSPGATVTVQQGFTLTVLH